MAKFGKLKEPARALWSDENRSLRFLFLFYLFPKIPKAIQFSDDLCRLIDREVKIGVRSISEESRRRRIKQTHKILPFIYVLAGYG